MKILNFINHDHFNDSQHSQLILFWIEAEVFEEPVPLGHHLLVHGVPAAQHRPLPAPLHVAFPGLEGRLRLSRLQQLPVNTGEELVTLDILALEPDTHTFLKECANKAL